MTDKKSNHFCKPTDATFSTASIFLQQLNQIMNDTTFVQSYNKYHNDLHITIESDMGNIRREYLSQELENLSKRVDCKMIIPPHEFPYQSFPAIDPMQVKENTKEQEKVHTIAAHESCPPSDYNPAVVQNLLSVDPNEKFIDPESISHRQLSTNSRISDHEINASLMDFRSPDDLGRSFGLQTHAERNYTELIPHFTISEPMLDSSISPVDLPPMFAQTHVTKCCRTQTHVTKCCRICSAKAKFPCISPELCESCWDKEHTCQKCRAYKPFEECLTCHM
jgi:hypothetical protein